MSTVSMSLAAGKGHKTYTNASKAGECFALQGEYAGSILINGDDVKYGVQVIALGKGKYRLVAYHGGLPGAGWDKS
ncbi:MAG: DUF1080 domain-containing protein, partial [Planctomycetota bacterium]|nr:DUF1080 domain-containing protein [Planctomycetota bacterium]